MTTTFPRDKTLMDQKTKREAIMEPTVKTRRGDKMKQLLTASAVFVLIMGIAGSAQGKRMVLTEGVEDVLLRTKLSDNGERINDSDLAHKNLSDVGRSRVGYKDSKEGRVLLRFDVEGLNRFEWKKVDKVQVNVPVVYPSHNDPELRLYAISEQDGDWKFEEATWREKKEGEKWSGGFGGGEPGGGTFEKKILATANPEGKHNDEVEFEIPSRILGRWFQSDSPEGNPGLMLTMNEGNAVNVETSATAGATPSLVIEGEWNVPEEFYRNVSGTVRMLGASSVQKRLFEKYLSSAFEEYNPNLEKKPINDISGRWSKMQDRGGGAFKFVKEGRYDVTLLGRLTWERRVPEGIKENMRYIPVAKQGVYRNDELVGGVEYGIAVRKEGWNPRVEAFVQFCKSDLVQQKLAEENVYHYMPADAELPEFEREEWEDPEPWKGPKPMMVHGVDIHVNGWTTAWIAQLARAQMKGYNSALSGGPDAVLDWADDNGFLISGGANPGSAERIAKHPSCWATFLENEDSANAWVKKLYHDFSERDENKWPERVKDFREARDGGFSDWARKKHGSLEQLNSRWNTDYESWDEISLPDPGLDEVVDLYDGLLDLEGNEGWQWRLRIGFRGVRHTFIDNPELLDFMRYMVKVWAKNYDERIKAMREYLGDDYLYSTKSKPDPYEHRASDQFNQGSFDYGPGKQHPHATQEFIDGVQIPLGWPVWDSEDHKYNHNKSTPRRVRVDIFSEYLMGQFQSTSYDWVKNNRRGARARYKAAMRTRRQIRRNEEVFRAFYEARKNADLAVFMNEGNRAFDVYDPMNEPYELGATVKAFGYMDALGRPWKYVMDLDLSAESVTGTLVLDAPWLTDESAEKLAELPEDRRIIAVGEVPNTNEYGEPLPEEALNKLKDRAEVIEDWEAISNHIKPVEGLMEPYTRVSSAGFHTWNRHRGMPRWTNQKPVARLALRRVEHNGNLYLAVVNWKDEAITAPIPWSEGKTVYNLASETPDEPVKNTDSYKYPKEGVALFKIQ